MRDVRSGVRRCVRTLAASCLMSVGVLAGPASSSVVDAHTVCAGNWDSASKYYVVKRNGTHVANLWVHRRFENGTKTATCLVLRAKAYKGIEKYMSVDVCTTYGPVFLDCKDRDAGRFRWYAGPVYYYGPYRAGTHINIKRPNGTWLVRNYRITGF